MAHEKQLVSFSLVFLIAAVAMFAGQAQGTDICQKADYVPLCRAVVKGAADPETALKNAIEHLISETKRAKGESAKLGNSQPLDVCNQNFESAIDDLQTSLENIKSKDKFSLNINLSAAVTYFVTCDDAVAEGGIVKQAAGVLNTDTVLRHMASNCLYLATLTH